MELYARLACQGANNPSSAHGGGLEAARLVQEARQSIARSLDCLPQEVYFTSGGTESINLALKGAAYAGSSLPKRAVTSAGEHDAVDASLSFLEEHLDYQLVRAALQADGRMDLAQFSQALEEEPAGLVSVIAVSNETGAINPLEQVVSLVREKAPRALVHSDIVQACGKLPFSFRRTGLDMVSVAGHKIRAPKGTGLLIKAERVKLQPLLHGGRQESGLRSGTVDMPGAQALALALSLHTENLQDHYRKTLAARNFFLDCLARHPLVFHTISSAESSPYVLSIAFPGLRGETLMNALSAEEIFISTGSACGSRKAGDNRVLSAMGLEREIILSAARISFHPDLDHDAIRHLADRIAWLHGRYAVS